MNPVKLITLAAITSMMMSFTVMPSPFIHEMEFKNYDGSPVVWKNEEIDLGKIPHGKPVTVEFKFTNKGKEALIISNVSTSCGCTVADYSKKPILANESSSIKATYNASNPGAFTKAVTVTFANNEKKVLNIKGTVVE
ncbi:MAG: DUF1573 domain-containing protein [Ginsengibacter sp.]